MKWSPIVPGCIMGCVLAASAFAARNVEDFKTTSGALKITTVMHAGLVIEAGGQVVIVDPAQGSWDGIPQADLILITDIHGDHMNSSMIAKVKKSGGVVIAPGAVAKTVTETQILGNGETKTIGAWKIAGGCWKWKHGFGHTFRWPSPFI